MADDPRDLADSAENLTQARALRDRFAADLASPNLPNDQAANLDDAIDELEAEWPELQERPASSPRARGGRRSSGASSSRPARRRSAGTSSRERAAGSSRARGGRSSSSGFAGPRLRSYWRRTGVPGAASTGTDIALSAIGGTFGLILLYLFIANRSGTNALTTVIGGFSTALQHFLEPVDPLRSTAKVAHLGGGRTENLRTNVVHGPKPAGPAGPVGPRGRNPRHAVGSGIGGG